MRFYKTTKIAVVAVFITIAVASTALSESVVLTEAGAVDRALSQNLQLEQRRVGLTTSSRNAETAWNALIPEVSLSGSLVRNNEEITLPPPGADYHTVLSAQVQARFTFSFASIEGIETARLRYHADQLSYEEAEREIARETRKLFYTLILQEEQIAVARNSVRIAEDTLDQRTEEYRNGITPEVTVRQAEVTVENRRLALQRQETAYSNTLAQVRLLLGIPQERTVELSGSIDSQPQFDAMPIVNREELTRRPDVRAITANIAAQRSAATAQRQLAWTPSLSLSASYNPNLADPFDPDNPANDNWSEWNDRGSLSVTISVPVSNYLPVSKSSVEVFASEDAIDSLGVQRESILESALSEVSTLKRQLDSSHRSIESLELGLRLAEEVYELTLEAYEQGATDFLDVQEAEDDREQARYDLLRERFTYLTTLIDLEYALNSELREGTELRSQK